MSHAAAAKKSVCVQTEEEGWANFEASDEEKENTRVDFGRELKTMDRIKHLEFELQYVKN